MENDDGSIPIMRIEGLREMEDDDGSIPIMTLEPDQTTEREYLRARRRAILYRLYQRCGPLGNILIRPILLSRFCR